MKLHFSNLILKYKHNIKKTWKVIKESIGKGKRNHQSFPKKIKLDGKNITNEDFIAKHFNTYFTEIGPKLGKTISSIFTKLCKLYGKLLRHTSRKCTDCK